MITTTTTTTMTARPAGDMIQLSVDSLPETQDIMLLPVPKAFMTAIFLSTNLDNQETHLHDYIIDRPQNVVVCNFGRVCLSGCVSVCPSDDDFPKALT